jgi:hypothetical protein
MAISPFFQVVGDLVKAFFNLGLKKESDTDTDNYTK